MPESPDSYRVSLTCDRLVELLSTFPRYVRAWRVHGQRQRSGGPNQRAIAQVISNYLCEIGEVADDHSPVKIKNVIYRAFKGERLSGKLLDIFTGAFDMTEEHQRELWSLLTGDANAIQGTIRKPREMGKPQWHRTISLFERWSIGSDRTLLRRHIVQCVEAKENGVDSYLFNHEPQATQIDVIQGGWLGRHYEYGDGLISDDIVLDGQVLKQGERAAIEYAAAYETDFRPTEVRRPARGKTTNVSLAVHFEPDCVPSRVWFATWEDHYLGGPVNEVRVPISRTHNVARSLEYIEQTVVGFRWEW